MSVPLHDSRHLRVTCVVHDAMMLHVYACFIYVSDALVTASQPLEFYDGMFHVLKYIKIY